MATEQLYNACADTVPIAIKGLKAGETKYWCRCGLSKKQPWCDGSHQGTGIAPLKWEVEKDGDYYVCLCKQTNGPPLCDGNHIKAKENISARAAVCKKAGNHGQVDCKLCTGCGWTPEF